jgi:hypothetical protein
MKKFKRKLLFLLLLLVQLFESSNFFLSSFIDLEREKFTPSTPLEMEENVRGFFSITQHL